MFERMRTVEETKLLSVRFRLSELAEIDRIAATLGLTSRSDVVRRALAYLLATEPRLAREPAPAGAGATDGDG